MFFQRTVLLHHPTGSRDNRISPDGEFSLDFQVPARTQKTNYALRISGETDEFWKWRTEGGNPFWIAESIEDSLVREVFPEENFALSFSGKEENFERNAYILLKSGTFRPGCEYRFEVLSKSEDLCFTSDGEALCELGIYLKKEGRAPDDVFDMPDQVIQLKLAQGTHEGLLSEIFIMPENTSALLVRVGFFHARGKAWFGTPRLLTEGEDSPIPLLDTTQYRFPEYNWLGENLDRRLDPCFEIRVDGNLVFQGEQYNPIYRRPDFTVALPDLAQGKHSLTIHLCSTCPNSVGFLLFGLELLEEGADTFEIIASPEFFPEQTPCPILIRTNQDNVNISGYVLKKKGFHVLTLPPMAAGAGINVDLSSGDCHRTVEFRSITAGKKDGLRLSTSDAVFIHQSPEDFLHYLQWYTGNRIGNTLRFRPSWRWSGSRCCDESAWKTILPLLRQMNMDYVLMVDGRELPGKNANPSDNLLSGQGYLGRQAHENDGAFYYWGTKIYENPPQPIADILARSIDIGGIRPHIRPPRNHGRSWRYFDPTDAKDMKEASEKFVANLKKARGSAVRHSGPSTLFRYFFQAGYRYLEAEQMYGPEEVILSALRGASRAYGINEFGVHLATQWSSTPHNTPEHAERYWLSLCCAYMQGASQFNVEEGLWRMEKGFVDHDRFSENAARHLAAHTRFRRFMEAHRRRGHLVIPVGVVQGRYDGWCSFSRGNVWSREGSKWNFSDPEKSFDLLNVFFPRSRFDAIYECPCSVEPHGWYSGTPFGPVDLFPVEGDFSAYRTVIFLGWHTFEMNDGKKLLDFVLNGGRLLLAAPHLSTETERNKSSVHLVSAELDALLGEKWQQANRPLSRLIGKGKVLYFPEDRYPACIGESYRTAMRTMMEETIREEYRKGWIEANEDVNFTVYDDEKSGLRVIYLLNIRWWDCRCSSVSLLMNGIKIPLAIPYGTIQVLTIADGTAIQCGDELTDVIALDGHSVTLQSPESGEMEIFQNGVRKTMVHGKGISVLRI